MALTKKIEYKDIYSFDDLMSVAPLNEAIYSVSIGKYGCVHDVGTIITFTLDGKGEGWDTLEDDFRKVVTSVKEAWGYSINHGYH